VQHNATVTHYHGPERRAHKRYQAEVNVREMIPGKQFFKPLTLGYGGISCLVERGYTQDTLVVMEIDLQDGSMPFTTPARVIRLDKTPEGSVMALRFMMPQMQLGPYFEKLK
jgi:hypothetical protein